MQLSQLGPVRPCRTPPRPQKSRGARSIRQPLLLWVISTNGRWVQARQLRPQLRKVRSGVARRTTADPMITGSWRRSQDAAATPYSEEGAVDYPLAYHAPRFNASRPVSSVAITSPSQKASSMLKPRRLNHTQLLITFAYHWAKRIFAALQAFEPSGPRS